MQNIDWQAVFGPGLPWFELVVRGSAFYWFLFLIFRVVLRRDVGSLAISDVLLLVLIADASQNAMAGAYTSIADGAILVGTLVFWNYMLDWAAYHLPFLQRLFQPGPLPLIDNGKILWRNMRREFITQDELMGKLRENGVEQPDQVKRACLENDGSISVIKFEDAKS